jgi:general secretion pathway protein D
LLLTAGVLPAQDNETDRAVATLRQGVAKYKALDFVAAKDTFLKVDRSKLSDADKASLDEYLSKIDLAIRKQAAAMSTYEAAVKAMQANDLVKAKELFDLVASSEYLPEPVRRDARAQLALAAKTVPYATATPASQPAAPTVRLELPPTTPPAAPPEAPPPAPAAVTAIPAASTTAPTTEPAAEPDKVLGGVLERRAKANVLVTEGKQALASDDPRSAAAKFEQALTLVPEMQEARVLLQQAQALMTAQAGPLTVLEQKRQIRRQQIDVEFDQALKRSSELLMAAGSASDFDAASEAARLAENVLQTHRTLYAVGEYRDRLAEVAKRLDAIGVRRGDWEKAQIQRQLEQMAQAEADRARRVRQQLDQQITTLTENAKTLREEQKYSQALEVVQQIVRLQPTNSWAADQDGVLRQFILIQEQKEIVGLRQTEEIRSLTDVQESAIPWYEHIVFPRNWREQAQWREGKGMSSLGWEEDRRIRQALREGLQAPLDIDVEKPLSEVIKQLEKMMGINIRMKTKYLESVGYSEEGTLVGPLRLVKVTNEKILRTILDDASGANVGTPNELSYTVDSGEITISTRQDLSRPVVSPEVMHVRVYDTRDILRGWSWAGSQFRSLDADDGDYSGLNTTLTAGGAGGGGGGGGTETGTAAGAVAEEANAAPNERLRTLIRSSVDPASWEPNGAGQINIWNDQLVVRQTPANHAAIADLLNEIRQVKDIQVSIEAKFLTVSSSYLEDVGVDLDFYFTKLGSHWSNINVLQDSCSFTSGMSTGLGSIGEDVSSNAATISGSFLDDVQVNFLIRATQAHEDTRMLTAPRLTLLSGTHAQIWVGEIRTYIDNIDWTYTAPTQYTPGYWTADITTAPLTLGTRLRIDASVSADLKYVTLRIRPRIDRLIALEDVELSIGQAAPQTFLQLIDVARETLDTTVTVPDGGTLLLGGLKRMDEVEREMGVPILSKIPIINRGFTNRSKVKDDSTLLILIKPTIIVPRDDEKRLFP